MYKSFLSTNTAEPARYRNSHWLFPVILGALLVGCDSGSGGGSVTPEDQTPTVTPENQTPIVTPEDQAATVTPGTVLSGTLQAETFDLYKVPTGAQIILTSNSGDADIFLHEGELLTEDSVRCIEASPFVEDICSATSTTENLYATVFASEEESSYTITATNDCSTTSINRWAYRSMLDYYLYADQVPVVNPDNYSDVSDLIRELRFNPPDRYSNVADAATRNAFLEEGKSFGFGSWMFRDSSDNLRIALVYDDSPFGRAGVKRGDIVSSIGGIPEADITSETYQQLIGTVEDPLIVEWQLIDGDTGELKTLSAARSEFTINTVVHYNYFVSQNFDGRVGYLMFQSFLRVSEAELDQAFGELAEAEVTELVLDLRYNGGGFTSIARQLASQIAGATVNAQQAVRYEYNNKYRDLDFQTSFDAENPSLNLTRVIVLTSEFTASASELVINALRPYIEVVTIGSTTEGKAFISAGRDFCGKTINAMEAQGVNANGVSVAGGIPADCYAADDLSRNFGMQSGSIEGMLLDALQYLSAGTCNAPPVLATSRQREGRLLDDGHDFTGAIDDLNNATLPALFSSKP